ncbi:MAG: urease accessory protein UreE [Alphaproteobacteria bacterium]|mgnify:CR=1 FL=1|jgi:urease accessory protein|nr:urease accessory protein UreE [Alphaproteobacteria bacterium]|tara:strand:- start:16 stop:477 length:462 start_codon:yes stop_codon:yes gene_type:complete
MERAIAHFNASAWPSEQATDGVTLAFDERHRRRIRLHTDNGEEILLDLPKAIAMAHGDGLRISDGRWLAVRAAPEPLLEIRCATPLALLRMAWHLGNRHLPTDVTAERLRIRPDHVIEAMARAMGAQVDAVTAPFQPEGGAYDDQGDGHHHDH